MRDRKQRGGKVVTVIAGLPLPAAEIAQLTSDLKRLCGSGGTVRGDTVEIQGDHRERLIAELRQRGFTVKAAGG
jgi:translation initiation factor 1